MASIHIAMGNSADNAVGELQRAAKNSRRVRWTMTSKARPGDLCVFYVIAPVQAFVATGIIDSMPTKDTNPSSARYGISTAWVADVTMLGRPVPLTKMRAALPRWGYLKHVRTAAQVPPANEAVLLKVLGSEGPPGPHLDEEAIEGLRHEMKRMISKRSRALRNAKLAKANGVCECCKVNFGALLNGAGAKVLLVHHRRQLSARSSPSITKESDLAVVCANCHALIHADPKKAKSVGVLAGQLKSARRTARAR